MDMTWRSCKNLLVIRLDNMGDLLMSVPAINALKQTFKCKITVLTSSAGKDIAAYIPAIDQVIVYDVPWMKSSMESAPGDTWNVIELLKKNFFDGAVLFTVFSQNPLPTAMLAYLAEIPLRLAYCRENPYQLLTDWVPEIEPYEMVRHQVKRDLALVKHIGATADNDIISIAVPENAWERAQEKFANEGIDLKRQWVIFHAGVSEIKRKYPISDWVETARKVRSAFNCQIVLTGLAHEKPLTENIRSQSGPDVFSLSGALPLDEFIMAIRNSSLVVTVNTATAHIAAATSTKVIVLYAMTNPQHTPWKVEGCVMPFSVPEELKSKNEVLRFVDKEYFPATYLKVSPDDIVEAAEKLFGSTGSELIPECVDFFAFDRSEV
jgi:ADP-heptose:LPS heptosyltransferase